MKQNILQVDWTASFKGTMANPDCDEVDFMVMMHPRNKPSKYKISDFALKGQRTTTLFVEKDQDYVFQVRLCPLDCLGGCHHLRVCYRVSNPALSPLFVGPELIGIRNPELPDPGT